MDRNPFPVTAYQGPEYFCNRSAETDVLREALHNGRNMTLFSLRTMGKTGLIALSETRNSFFTRATKSEILEPLEKQKHPNYIAIDEFQQISRYPESARRDHGRSFSLP